MKEIDCYQAKLNTVSPYQYILSQLPNEEWLKTLDIARALGKSPQFIRNRVRDGTLPAHTITHGSRKTFLFRRCDILHFIKHTTNTNYDHFRISQLEQLIEHLPLQNLKHINTLLAIQIKALKAKQLNLPTST